MSSLEEKLKSMAMQMEAYRPMEEMEAERPAPKHILRVNRRPLFELSEGLEEYAQRESAVSMLNRNSLPGWDIRKTVFLDTETTGLMGVAVVAFLVGIGYIDGDEFVTEQYFMQDYNVEGEMLSSLCDKLQHFDFLVTFNGKCFDAPLLSSRSVMNRIVQPIEDMQHLDLLFAARRLWKRRLKSCSLQSLEREILGVERQGDIPGSLIPSIFFAYLQGNAGDSMEMVLKHNHMDVESMYALLCRMCAMISEPEKIRNEQDLHACGVLLHAAGEVERAEQCYRDAAFWGWDEAYKALANLFKSQERYDEAAEVWQQMMDRDLFGPWPYQEMAKYWEHRRKDAGQALEVCELCQRRLLSSGLGRLYKEDLTLLSQRKERLKARLKAQNK